MSSRKVLIAVVIISLLLLIGREVTADNPTAQATNTIKIRTCDVSVGCSSIEITYPVGTTDSVIRYLIHQKFKP